MRRDRLRRWLLLIALFVLVFLPLFTGGIDLIVDWLWFSQEGFKILYTVVLKTQIALSGYAGFAFMVVVAANLLVARAIARGTGTRVNYDELEFPLLGRFTSAFRWAVWLGVLFIGYFVGQWAMTHWQDVLLAEHVQSLDVRDPLFNLDVGFYLFVLPFRWFLYHLALATLVACFLSAVLYYLIEGGVWVTPRGPQLAPAARRHLLGLGALAALLAAYRLRLAMYDLLFSPRGVLYGAGYTDVHATLPALQAMLFLALLTALAFVWGVARGSARPGIAGAALTAIVGIVGGGIYPAIVQRLSVAPNEFEKEKRYLESAIQFTRRAYALDRFEEREFPVLEDLKLSALRENQPTMRNVRMWDHRPLLTTFQQLQELRPYYDFEKIDNDRYWINGVYRQVSLSPRELATSRLPSQSRSWINERVVYTHGYGLCLGPVNESTPDGLPELFIHDIPPVSSIPLHITQPEIYFGEIPNDYCLVRTNQQEFDYPKGREDAYSTYQGPGGVPAGSFLRRLLMALKFGEVNLILPGAVNSASRIMLYRQVLERAGRLAPFLRFDADPYLVVTDSGELVWILDGYTFSSRYPYSQPTEDLGNYVRNSVKATISAYSGRVHFYVSDSSDPLIRAYQEIFPGVFEPLGAMPKDLVAHLRYPEGFFSIQAAMYAVFHMSDPRVFYNKEDLWRVAQSSTGTPMSPYYTIMKLAEVGTAEEFILMVPFSPARKDNMIAWMAARCDGADYGKVLVFTFPKQKLVYGPLQIASRINQDPSISQQLSLWDQRGSRVIHGTLLVIPVLNSLIYAEPLYLSSDTAGALPELKRVIVAYSDQVAMEPSLDEALARIFGGTVEGTAKPAAKAAAAKPAEAAPGMSTLIREARQHYDLAQQLLRQGDWAGYGEEMNKLGETLKRISPEK